MLALAFYELLQPNAWIILYIITIYIFSKLPLADKIVDITVQILKTVIIIILVVESLHKPH